MRVQVGDTECRGDYVLVPGGWGGTNLNNQRFTRDRSATNMNMNRNMNRIFSNMSRKRNRNRIFSPNEIKLYKSGGDSNTKGKSFFLEGYYFL